MTSNQQRIRVHDSGDDDDPNKRFDRNDIRWARAIGFGAGVLGTLTFLGGLLAFLKNLWDMVNP